MEQFTGPHTFSMDAWISCAPFERFLHMNIVEASNGKATLTMPFTINLSQGAGLMHGGALVSLADTAVVMAIKSLLPPQTHFATISLQSTFLYPVKKGVVTAKARVTKRDGRILYGQVTVYNDTAKPVLELSSTFKVAKDAEIKGIVFQDNQAL